MKRADAITLGVCLLNITNVRSAPLAARLSIAGAMLMLVSGYLYVLAIENRDMNTPEGVVRRCGPPLQKETSGGVLELDYENVAVRFTKAGAAFYFPSGSGDLSGKQMPDRLAYAKLRCHILSEE